MGHLPSQGSSVLSGQTSNVWPREKRDTARATSHLSRLNGECHIMPHRVEQSFSFMIQMMYCYRHNDMYILNY